MRTPKLLDYSQMMKVTIYSMTRAYISCQLETIWKEKGLTKINLPDTSIPADPYENSAA